jgi:dipeptidyl aminopeptidase/acylaminoacyl peptidase
MINRFIKCSVMLSIFFICINGMAQKLPLPINAEDDWETFSGPSKISNDGKYFAFTVQSGVRHKMTTIRTIDSTWCMNIPDVLGLGINFTDDSKYALFKVLGDTLKIVDLRTKMIETIQGVGRFTIMSNDNAPMVAYTCNDTLILKNIHSGKSQSFVGVKDYWASQYQLVISQMINSTRLQQRNSYMDFKNKKLIPFFEGGKIANVIFDKFKKRLAFTVKSNDNSGYDVCLYDRNKNQVIKLLDSKNNNIGNEYYVEENAVTEFTEDGKRILLSITEKKKHDTVPSGKRVSYDLWSYTDAVVQSEQQVIKRELAARINRYKCIVIINEKRLVQLEHKGTFTMFPEHGYQGKRVMTIEYSKSFGGEWNWNKAIESKIYEVSAITGKRKSFDLPLKKPYKLSALTISPDEEFIVYYDAKEKNYFSYHLATGTIRNLTSSVKTIWTSYLQNDLPESAYYGYVSLGWRADSRAVYINDQYDIWEIDPYGHRQPVNVTNGYGKKNNILFRPAIKNAYELVAPGKWLLTAFNLTTKENGFYAADIIHHIDPEKLSMGQYCYQFHEFELGRQVMKSADADCYIVTRETAAEAPDYYATTDFRQFTRLSNVHPERKYNWLTAELVNWTTAKGTNLQGVLYKPENFDAQKKYPVIFLYYDKISHQLNKFINPEPSVGPINIPYFVSNGYMVFTPDIQFNIGTPGESALDAVVSAASYLSQFKYIDSTKMAINGHSFGGYLTNYIVTHTTRFAAACSGAGITDCATNYNLVSHNGRTRQYFYENSQLRIGATLWDRPDLFIQNSPLYAVNKVETPVLLMHNQHDNAVPFQEGLIFFTSLRRLGKRVWMMQYDEQKHTVDGESAIDWTMRMKQFFDHYLKDAAAPQWMLDGIPASEKGKTDGFELDPARVPHISVLHF